ncbi:choice-of-anchor J domain-containing protein, partial [uncultured Olleya sp.]|uniref:choice-of-anchor J domain-containing protein n=1 Tax=uncultured Olleya sp. TaxID=757243 RepID=UPI002595B651
MKKTTFFLALLFLLVGWQANSQIYLQESFDTSIPASWTITDAGDATGDSWISGQQGTSSLDGTNAALVDSDAAGSGTLLQETLTTPVFDASAATTLFLDFDQYFRNIGSDTGTVEVWDGTAWVAVLTQTASAGGFNSPDQQHIDITAYANAAMQVRFIYDDASSWAWYWLVDNVLIYNATCPNPSALTVDALTETSVDLSWTAGGTETAWEVVVQPSGTGVPTGSGTGTTINTPYSDNTLSPATDYEVYVRSDCSGDFSVWSGPISFTTDCDIFTPDYLQDFTTIPANCWEVADSGDATTGPSDIGTSSWTTDGYLNNGTTGAYKINLWVASKSDWLLTPEFDLTGGPFQVEFDLGVMTFGSTTTAGTLGSDDIVELMITTDSGTTWTVLQSFDASTVFTSAGMHVVENLSTYSGATAQFGIRASEGVIDDPTDNDVFVDNFQVRSVPSCSDPLSIVAIATGDTTADITWDAGGTETEWQVWVQTAGTGEPTTDGVVTTVNNPYSVINLTPSTAYEVYVRSNCGVDGYSAWVGPVNFTTLNTPPPAPVGVACATGSSTFIFTEDFGNDTNYVPSGWTGTAFTDTNGDWDITTESANSSSTGPDITWDGNPGTHLEYEGSGNTTNVASAITPAIDLSTAVDGAELSFYMHAFGGDMGTLNIGVSTSQTGPFTNEYTWVGDYQSAGDEAWVPIGVNLDAYLGQVIYIEISYVGTGDTWESDMAIDQVRVETCGDFCVAPTSITVDAITDTTADLSWIANNFETAWEVVVQAAGTGMPTTAGTTVTTNPYTATGLTASTAYEVYILADCGSGTSVWAGPINFTTLNTPPPAPTGVACATGNSTFIFTEDFGNDTNYIPSGWTGTAFTDTNGDWDITTESANSSSTGPDITWDGNPGTHLEYEGSGNTTNVASAITPAIDLSTAVDGAELSFYMHAFGGDMGTLNIGVSTSQTGPFNSEYTWVGDYQNTADEAWIPIGVNLDTYLGQVIYIEISYVGTGDTWESDMAIDQVRVEACGTFCVAPTAITATSITETAADISWTPSGAETEWNYVLQPLGTGVPTSGTTVTTTTISETALTPLTDYEVYVQAVCGTDTSTWAGPFNFSTLAVFNFTLDCATDGPQTIDYCYDSNDTNVFTFSSTDGTPLNLTINAGQVENSFDEVVVLDSDGVTNLNAATPYGNAGQIGGLTFQSTGDTISFAIESDGSISCQSSGYTSVNLTVSCATCINPTATFVVVDDCDNVDQFLVDVDITSLGDATSLLIEDNQGTAPMSVTTTGIQQFGPYPFNVDIQFTVSNEQDVNCVINSNSISLAACPPVNDNPCNATVASVNADETCTIVNSGTLLEATDSGVPNGSCSTSADDDVWYEFTALGDQQIIQIQNVIGGFNVDHAVYEGSDCNNLTELYCTTDDNSLTPSLIVGNTYYIRVFSAGTTETTITFDLCIQTLGVPTYCTDALPICADPTIFYPSIVGDQIAPPYIDYDCLGSQPDPQWNTIQFDDPGDYVFQLAQTNDSGVGLDIDFLVWGPFTGQDTGCFELLPSSIADCSFSGTATETITLTNVPANSVYIILITNYSQQSGSYVFTQQSGPLDGTNCDVVCEVALDYDGISIEQGATTAEGFSDDINLCGYTSVTLTADTAYAVDSYDWYVNNIYQDGATGPTFEATESGQYMVIVGGGICDDFTSSLVATINFFDNPIANQVSDLEVCDDSLSIGNGVFDLESQTATILGTQDPAEFIVTYHETLSDAQSGVDAIVSDYTATDGTTIFVRVEDVDAVGSMSGCASTNTNFNLVVNTLPVASQPVDMEVCDDESSSNTFDLTEDEVTTIGTQTNVTVTYYTSEDDALNGVDFISNPQSYTVGNDAEVIYVRVENSTSSDCFAITSFNVAFSEAPETTFDSTMAYEVCPNATSPITITAEAINYTASEVSIVWYNEGVIIPGANNLALNTVLTAGEYEIEVTFNDTGCSQSAFVEVTELETCIIPQG